MVGGRYALVIAEFDEPVYAALVFAKGAVLPRTPDCALQLKLQQFREVVCVQSGRFVEATVMATSGFR